MATILVTGATGLIGSNICAQLLERGDTVRALVRPGSDARDLEQLGATIVTGDITNAAAVQQAAAGCSAAIHSAAILGGAVQDPDRHRSVNVEGLAHVLAAADRHGLARVVALGTTTYFNFREQPLSEQSPIDLDLASDPYSRTKGEAHLRAIQHQTGDTQVCVVIPGGTYGPAPTGLRALEAPSYNLRLRNALAGHGVDTVAFPIPWSFAPDVAAVTVAAADRGRGGRTYLALGNPHEVGSMATFVNRGCEIAGVSHRVKDLNADAIDNDPDLASAVGPSLVALAHQQFPEPFFTNEATRRELDYTPCSLDEGLARTIAWLATLPRS